MNPIPGWITISAASKLRGIQPRTIRLAITSGYIPGAYKAGRDWLLPVQEFLHWTENRPKPGRKPRKEG